jgi:hypothetical protein
VKVGAVAPDTFTMGTTFRERAAGVALGVSLPSGPPGSQHEPNLPVPDPIDAAVTVVQACARLVANNEISPREGAAIVVKVDREVSHLATRRAPRHGSLGISEIVDLCYVCDMDCEHLDDAARFAIESEIREAFRDLAGTTAR